MWAGEPELIAFFDRQVIKEETCNENCKLFITDPELERTPPHPYSVANVCWQNICKGIPLHPKIQVCFSTDPSRRRKGLFNRYSGACRHCKTEHRR